MRSASIFDSETVTQYLGSVYRARKQLDTRFSYRRWADELGFEDKAFLREIVNARRAVSERSENRFLEALSLEGRDAEHFRSLCRENRERFASLAPTRIAAAAVQPMSPPSGAALTSNRDNQKLSDPQISVLQVLLSCEGLTKTSGALAAALKLSEATVVAWLLELERHGLARRHDDGLWVGAPLAIESRAHHQKILLQAAGVVEQAIPAKRIRTLIAALSDRELEELLARTESFSSLRGRRLYRMTVAVHSVGKSPGALDS